MTAFDLAQRFVGVRETPGVSSNPVVLAMLQLDATWVHDDAVPWCSAFMNYVAWLLRLPRSKSLAARSWLTVGRAIEQSELRASFDVVIFKRGGGVQPGPEVLDAPGHVALFAGWPPDPDSILVLGGNQNDTVSVQSFPLENVLGYRRLTDAVSI